MVQMSTVGDERAAPSNAASCFVDVVDRLSGVSGHGWGGLGFCARWLDYDVVEVEGMGAVQPRMSAMQLSAQWLVAWWRCVPWRLAAVFPRQ